MPVTFDAATGAARDRHPRRIFLTELIYRPGSGTFQRSPIPGYHLVSTHTYRGIVGVAVQVLASDQQP